MMAAVVGGEFYAGKNDRSGIYFQCSAPESAQLLLSGIVVCDCNGFDPTIAGSFKPPANGVGGFFRLTLEVV